MTKRQSTKRRSKVQVKTTALARRPVGGELPGARLMRRLAVDVLPAERPTTAVTLSEETVLGDLGLVEIKLTEKEEAVLAELVHVDDVRMKPSGQPYLSHPSYTAWFNRAFGRLGWSVRPAAKASKTERGVIVPYLLYIHGQPAAFAMGEQDYHESNREQSYGDAIEATVGSALRRLAKRMGVGLELWDKAWLDRYVSEHCVKVKCVSDKRGTEYLWRRKVDPKFWNEAGVVRQGEQDEDVAPAQRRAAPAPPGPTIARPAGTHGKSGEPVTEAQLRRLWVIVRNSGRSEEVIKAWLVTRYGISSSKEIRRDQYDAVCQAIEADGPLPAGRG